MKRISGSAWKAAAAALVMACAISPAFAGHGGGGHGGGGHGGGGHGGGGHMGGGHMGGGVHHGVNAGSYGNTVGLGYHGPRHYGGGGFNGLGYGGFGLGGLGFGNLGYYGGYGGYGSSYPTYTYSSGYSSAPMTYAAPYLTNQTYEPGDGYRYPLYYNPATASYFYYPVAR